MKHKRTLHLSFGFRALHALIKRTHFLHTFLTLLGMKFHTTHICRHFSSTHIICLICSYFFSPCKLFPRKSQSTVDLLWVIYLRSRERRTKVQVLSYLIFYPIIYMYCYPKIKDYLFLLFLTSSVEYFISLSLSPLSPLSPLSISRSYRSQFFYSFTGFHSFIQKF